MKRFGPPPLFLIVLFLLIACHESRPLNGQEPAPEDADLATDQVAEELAPAADEPAGDLEAPDAGETLSSLDDRLPDEFAALTAPWTGDLDGMLERHVVRTLVIGGGPQFFYFRGKPRGIVTEMLVELQEQLNDDLDRRYRQLEIIPMPVSRDRLIPALVGGQADLVAADLTITEGRSDLVDFTRPLVTNIDEIVVFAPGRGDDVTSVEQLSGHSIYVRPSSSYFEHLVQLNVELAATGLDPIRIDPANELLRDQDILDMVNAGMVDATVIDSYKASYWSQVFSDFVPRADLVINKGGEIAWLIRKDSPLFKEALDKFVRTHRQGTLIGNVLINRYMENLQWVRNSTSDTAYGKLAPLYELFRAAAEEIDVDPLMLAAQAFQESELDHSKVSPVGARGIMQIKPSTAADRNVGIPDITAPADNIRAGARYMRFLMDRYFSDSGVEPLQSWFFALAAYNAGPAKVQNMRNLAEREGHDRNVWVDNVELIAERKIGRETVRYVRNIFKYYVAYRLAAEAGEQRRSMSINQ